MITGEFEYFAPATVAEAVQLLSENSYEAKLLAGGQSLIPAMRFRLSQPGIIVDINGIDGLSHIREDNGHLAIGAMTREAMLEGSELVQTKYHLLADAAKVIADPIVRNMATVGGNIAHADPASDPPTVLMAVGATINIKSKSGERSVSADDFFVDLFTTALQDGEIITSVSIPNMSSHKTAYAKFSHPASRFAVVGVCVALQMSGNTCSSARVAVGGATIKAVRCPGAEGALAGSSLDSAAVNAAAEAIKSDIADMLTGDINYPTEYRQQMAGVYLKRAIAEAVG